MRLFNDPPISRLGMLLAKWLGEKVVTADGEHVVVAYLWRDRVYIADAYNVDEALK